MMDRLEPQIGVYPLGEYSAWATPEGYRAQVRGEGGRVVKRFTGETAWSDSVRVAGDLNAADKLKK